MSQADAQDFETFFDELNKKRSMTNDGNMLLQLTLLNSLTQLLNCETT